MIENASPSSRKTRAGLAETGPQVLTLPATLIGSTCWELFSEGRDEPRVQGDIAVREKPGITSWNTLARRKRL